MLTQLESQPEYGGGSESGGCGDDEPGDDEDGGEDEEEEDNISRATCRPGKASTVALSCLTETMLARRCRPGRYPIRAFPFDVSRATCRPRNLSPATSRLGFPELSLGKMANVVVFIAEINQMGRPESSQNLSGSWRRPNQSQNMTGILRAHDGCATSSATCGGI
nr:hypothetical protein [Tanacetum cinerariifolium]